MEERIKGRVKFYDKKNGFGYVTRANGNKDVYISSDSFFGGIPSKNEKVFYSVIDGEKGPIANDLNNELIEYFKNIVLNLDDNDYDSFCDKTKDFAYVLKDSDIKTSMIRKVYSRILNSELNDIKKLRPQLAYIAGRNSEEPMKDFMSLLDFLIKKIETNNKKQLENLKQFMEAVVAYRKYAGGDI